MQPLIFDIQRFSIHDGDGIRTVVFFKGCNMKCPWCQNPESIDHRAEIAFYADKCEGNADCVTACPKDAITIGSEMHIDRSLCDRCGKCTEVCVSEALKLIGREYSKEKVMEEILKDMTYYQVSGGGVTFSGGEPSLHADFILEILKECKEFGIHTNIETNGYFKWEKFEPLLPYLDQIFFDLKILEGEQSKMTTGGNSQVIFSNMDKLIERNAPVEFRIPLVPEFTTANGNISALAQMLKEKQVKKVHLLPYHSMGETKGARVCSPLPKLNLPLFTADQLQNVQQPFTSRNIQTELYR